MILIQPNQRFEVKDLTEKSSHYCNSLGSAISFAQRHNENQQQQLAIVIENGSNKPALIIAPFHFPQFSEEQQQAHINRIKELGGAVLNPQELMELREEASKIFSVWFHSFPRTV